MIKIARLKLSPIFEATSMPEGEVTMVSTGANLSIKKDNASSALILDVSSGSARYNKIENEDLELSVLQNELAGIVGDFDNSVHKLLAKYGYQWVGEQQQQDVAPVEESINEDKDSGEFGGSPTGTWIGDFFVTDSIIINKFVDSAAGFYEIDDQKIENKLRRAVADLMKEEFSDADGAASDLSIAVSAFIDEHQNELAEFADYYIG